MIVNQQVRRWDTLVWPFLEDGAKIMLLMFLALAVVIFLAHALMAIFHRYPLDYGEAAMVDQAMAMTAGQNIYRRDLAMPPYIVSNYPPLYVLSLVPFVGLFGPSFLAGRIISALCSLASAVFLALIVRTYSQDRLAAAVTAMLFLAFPYVVGWSPLARVDMLALALSTAGLYVLVRWPTTWQGLVISALLLVAAVYTRQSYGLAAPLAAFVWLWTQDRRQSLRLRSGQALRLAALVGGIGLILFLALNVLTQGGFFFHVVTATVNEFGTERLERHWRDLRDTAPILLIFGGAFLILAPRRVRSWPLLAPYLVGAILSALTIGKIGSNINYLLELCAALSLVAGALVAWSHQRRWLHAVLLVLLALQVGQLMQATLKGPVEGLKWRLKPAGALKDLERMVETTDGPVLADEFAGMLTLQNRPLYIQPFAITQLANAGLWDQDALLTSIRDQEFPLILIHHFMGWPVYKERWTPEMLSAITKSYTPARFLAETIVFQPRDVDESGLADMGACPGAPWRLPTRGDMGVWWVSKRLVFMGEGYENTVPVFAVADGLLTRRLDWDGAVAIQHDDPLRPGEKVWSFYGDMASGWDDESFVVPDFPPGSEGVPVRRGQLLGYQGQRLGMDRGRIWVHLHFAVVPELEDGSFPDEMMERVMKGEPLPRRMALEFPSHPSPYLGTIRSQVMGTPDWLPWRCQENTTTNLE